MVVQHFCQILMMIKHGFYVDLHGEFESVWGTIQGPYDITFILKEKACQNRKLATYIRDLRDKNPQVASTVLILGSLVSLHLY